MTTGGDWAGPHGLHFCPRCGGRLEGQLRGDRVRPHCTECGRAVFHNPAVGVAVLLQRGEEVLLARRSRSYAGMWCIPCGYVEWDEDIRAAAVREMAEETGLIVELTEVVAVHSNFHDANQHTVGVWFGGSVLDGDLQPGDDVDAVAWFGLDALPDALAFPTDELVLADVARRANLSSRPPAG